MKLSFSIAQLGSPISNVLFIRYGSSKRNSLILNFNYPGNCVSKYLGEEGDFVSPCFRACEGNVGDYTQFVSYKMTTFWLALPSWLLKAPDSIPEAGV